MIEQTKSRKLDPRSLQLNRPVGFQNSASSVRLLWPLDVLAMNGRAIIQHAEHYVAPTTVKLFPSRGAMRILHCLVSSHKSSLLKMDITKKGYVYGWDCYVTLLVSLIGGARCERVACRFKFGFLLCSDWQVAHNVKILCERRFMPKRESQDMQWSLLNPDRGHSIFSRLNRKREENKNEKANSCNTVPSHTLCRLSNRNE